MKNILLYLKIIAMVIGLFLVYQIPTTLLALGHPVLGFILGCLVLLLFLAYYYTRAKELPPLFKGKNILLVGGGYIAITFANMIAQYFMSTRTTSNNEAIYDLSANLSTFSLFFMLCIMAPIAEEVIFRFTIIDNLVDIHDPSQKKQQWLALLVSSVAFCLPHVPDSIPAFFAYTAMGAIMGFVYMRSRRLEVSMLLHFINNFVPFYFIANFPELL